LADENAYILAAIDGTDSVDWRRQDGTNSHVYRFYNDFYSNGGTRCCWHGPNTSGTNLGATMTEVFDWVVSSMEYLMKKWSLPQNKVKVVLVGHSRGATGVIGVANKLKKGGNRVAVSPSVVAPVNVHFMGLYDTVNMSVFSVDTVMSNVTHCYHARRMHISTDPDLGSRGSFGLVSVAQAQTKSFDTSHGGIGGDPGFFENLDGYFKDLYCNAWTFTLYQNELNEMYGTGLFGGNRYEELTGDDYLRRKPKLYRFWQDSKRADNFIRGGAGIASLVFSSKMTHRPYPDGYAGYWERLHGFMTS
jgi:hypothetical protein